MLEKDYLVRQLREIIKICLAKISAIEEASKNEENEQDREASMGEALLLLDEAIENSMRLSPKFFLSTPSEFVAAMISQDRTPFEILEIMELLVEKSRVHRFLGQSKATEHVDAVVRSCFARLDKEKLVNEECKAYSRLNDRIGAT